MWSEDQAAFVEAYRVTSKQAGWFRLTAEHLVSKADGGTAAEGNIVAACLWCNRHRHLHRPQSAPDAAVYERRVRSLVAKGRWQPFWSASARDRYPLM